MDMGLQNLFPLQIYSVGLESEKFKDNGISF